MTGPSLGGTAGTPGDRAGLPSLTLDYVHQAVSLWPVVTACPATAGALNQTSGPGLPRRPHPSPRLQPRPCRGYPPHIPPRSCPSPLGPNILGCRPSPSHLDFSPSPSRLPAVPWSVGRRVCPLRPPLVLAEWLDMRRRMRGVTSLPATGPALVGDVASRPRLGSSTVVGVGWADAGQWRVGGGPAGPRVWRPAKRGWW